MPLRLKARGGRTAVSTAMIPGDGSLPRERMILKSRTVIMKRQRSDPLVPNFFAVTSSVGM